MEIFKKVKITAPFCAGLILAEIWRHLDYLQALGNFWKLVV
jgi:hypothetical protein